MMTGMMLTVCALLVCCAASMYGGANCLDEDGMECRVTEIIFVLACLSALIGLGITMTSRT